MHFLSLCMHTQHSGILKCDCCPEGTWALVAGIVVDVLRKHRNVGYLDPQGHSHTAMALPRAR